MPLTACRNLKKEVIRMDDSLTRRGDGRHQSGRDEVIVS